MTVWRYTAVPADGGPHRSGELTGETPADVRASLRRIGLQPIELKRIRSRAAARSDGFGNLVARHLRNRRGARKGELFDSIATLLDGGVPLLEAVETILAGRGGRSRAPERAMLTELRESLKSGDALATAMSRHAGWFDRAEVAMVEAGQHSGELSSVLRTLAERHERSGELSSKLIGALAYPAVIACVGVGVAVFLSIKTLPELTAILVDADVEVPRLTAAVMWTGQALVTNAWVLCVALIVGIACTFVVRRLISRWGIRPPGWIRLLVPEVIRRSAVAEAVLSLAELARVGVPLVEALRITAPSSPAGLEHSLSSAADNLEGGQSLSESLSDPYWFDAELRRLLVVGESGGELPDILERIGQRDRRRARRLIDRLAALLEPAVILVLAVLVGIVVMAAVLPLIRLQEII